MKALFGLIQKVIIYMMAFLFFVVLMIVGWGLWGKLVDDPRYAQRYFDGLFEYSEVLESRYWGHAGSWSCTYAIVRLENEPPPNPSERTRSEKGWRYAWGGNWSPTPAPELGSTTRDALESCGSEWETGVYEELAFALGSDGAFFARDGVGETVMIYAPEQRIAAYVRYGD